MWELPNRPGKTAPDKLKDYFDELGISAAVESAGNAKHIFTHVEWRMEGYVIRLERPFDSPEFIWCTKKELETRYPLPSAFKKYRKMLENML